MKSETKEKRKQARKAGHVVRLSDDAWSFVRERRESTAKEAVDDLIKELLDLTTRFEIIMNSPTYYMLPESRIVCDSIEEARGEAILRAVKRGKKMTEEEPIPVKAV